MPEINIIPAATSGVVEGRMNITAPPTIQCQVHGRTSYYLAMSLPPEGVYIFCLLCCRDRLLAAGLKTYTLDS